MSNQSTPPKFWVEVVLREWDKRTKFQQMIESTDLDQLLDIQPDGITGELKKEDELRSIFYALAQTVIRRSDRLPDPDQYVEVLQAHPDPPYNDEESLITIQTFPVWKNEEYQDKNTLYGDVLWNMLKPKSFKILIKLTDEKPNVESEIRDANGLAPNGTTNTGNGHANNRLANNDTANSGRGIVNRLANNDTANSGRGNVNRLANNDTANSGRGNVIIETGFGNTGIGNVQNQLMSQHMIQQQNQQPNQMISFQQIPMQHPMQNPYFQQQLQLLMLQQQPPRRQQATGGQLFRIENGSIFDRSTGAKASPENITMLLENEWITYDQQGYSWTDKAYEAMGQAPVSKKRRSDTSEVIDLTRSSPDEEKEPSQSPPTNVQVLSASDNASQPSNRQGRSASTSRDNASQPSNSLVNSSATTRDNASQPSNRQGRSASTSRDTMDNATLNPSVRSAASTNNASVNPPVHLAASTNNASSNRRSATATENNASSNHPEISASIIENSSSNRSGMSPSTIENESLGRPVHAVSTTANSLVGESLSGTQVSDLSDDVHPLRISNTNDAFKAIMNENNTFGVQPLLYFQSISIDENEYEVPHSPWTNISGFRDDGYVMRDHFGDYYLKNEGEFQHTIFAGQLTDFRKRNKKNARELYPLLELTNVGFLLAFYNVLALQRHSSTDSTFESFLQLLLYVVAKETKLRAIKYSNTATNRNIEYIQPWDITVVKSLKGLFERIVNEHIVDENSTSQTFGRFLKVSRMKKWDGTWVDAIKALCHFRIQCGYAAIIKGYRPRVYSNSQQIEDQNQGSRLSNNSFTLEEIDRSYRLQFSLEGEPELCGEFILDGPMREEAKARLKNDQLRTPTDFVTIDNQVPNAVKQSILEYDLQNEKSLLVEIDGCAISSCLVMKKHVTLPKEEWNTNRPKLRFVVFDDNEQVVKRFTAVVAIFLAFEDTHHIIEDERRNPLYDANEMNFNVPLNLEASHQCLDARCMVPAKGHHKFEPSNTNRGRINCNGYLEFPDEFLYPSYTCQCSPRCLSRKKVDYNETFRVWKDIGDQLEEVDDSVDHFGFIRLPDGKFTLNKECQCHTRCNTIKNVTWKEFQRYN